MNYYNVGWYAHMADAPYHSCPFTQPADRAAWRKGWMHREDAMAGAMLIVPVHLRQH